MSLKTDLEMVKEELTSEEKFFEKAVVTEKFVKKYKNVMIGSVVAVVLFVAGNITYNINKQSTLASANEALAKLEVNANNPATLATLENLSPALHDVWVYSQSIADKDTANLEKLTKSKTILIGDLASYAVAQNANDTTKLNAYAERQDAIYGDLARVESAIVLMQEKKIEESHEVLRMINLNSPLAKVAQALMHYGVK